MVCIYSAFKSNKSKLAVQMLLTIILNFTLKFEFCLLLQPIDAD
jgi:hypothetical protein